MDKKEIDLASIVAQCEDQVSTELDGETVLMSLEQGNYYGMDKILSRIWAIVEKPIAVSKICDQLMKEYDVERKTCEDEVLNVLNELAKENLLKPV